MYKYLITGFSGFVSYHFLKYLNDISKEKVYILGLDLLPPDSFILVKQKCTNLDIIFKKINMLDYTSLEKEIVDFKPSRILHLASLSSVNASWAMPAACFSNNTNIFLNLVEVIRRNNLKARILSIGSSEEYGIVNQENIPIVEELHLSPSNPYAIARMSQELLSQCYIKAFNMDIVLTRSFNHMGPRQSDKFVISHFTKELSLELLKNSKSITLLTGDTKIIRDFIDVRDVVKAYYLLFEKGICGEIYNVCSGTGHSLQEIIKKLQDITQINISQKTDYSLIRPIDNPIIIGSNKKVSHDTGWHAQIPLEQSLFDLLQYWKTILLGDKL